MQTPDNATILNAIDCLKQLCGKYGKCTECPLYIDVKDGTIWKTYKTCVLRENGKAPADWRLLELMGTMMEVKA